MKLHTFTITKIMSLTFILSGLLLGLGNSPSYAEDKGTRDYKSYPAASLCFSPLKDNSFTQSKMLVRLDGSIENTDLDADDEEDAGLQLVCPLMRDNAQTSSGLTVWIAYDLSPYSTDSLTCHFSSRDLEGTTFSELEQHSTNKRGVNIMSFSLPGSKLPPNGGIALLNCTIPHKNTSLSPNGSRLISILVGEEK